MLAVAAAAAVTILDLVEIELGYTTITEQYYRKVDTAKVLAGARDGVVGYLRGRGIAAPVVRTPSARPDGRGAVPSIEQMVGDVIVRYGDRVSARDLAYATIRGEVTSLGDRYSEFFPKRAFTAFATSLNGETFGGIGAIVHVDATAKGWRVDDVFGGAPAAKAGLRDGDLVTTLDGAPVEMSDAGAPERALRGAAGTVARLGVVRGGVPLDAPLAIVRAPVTPPEVTSRLLDGNVGYVALREFGPSAAAEVRRAFGALATRGATAYVFDLRGNGGGYESSSIAVAAAFVGGRTIMSEQTRRGHRVALHGSGTLLPQTPLAVLVDGNTASAAEIVAAAVQESHRGTLVGTRTYGKGLVQTVIPLPDGAGLKLTTARYFTATGRDIDRVGITPDVVVEAPPGTVTARVGSDPQLDAALARLRASAAPQSPSERATSPATAPPAP